jgi:type VI secretion system secreted protein Hcp
MKRSTILWLIGLLVITLLLTAMGCQKLQTESPEIITSPSSTEPSDASQEPIPPSTESTTTSQETVPTSRETTAEPSEPETVEPPVHSSAYIKFDGVDGESQSKGHEGWSEIVSFSQQITKPSGSITDVTRRRGDVILEDIVIVKEVDKASPKLAEAICIGKVYPKVEIHLTGPSEGSTCDGTFYVYVLENVMITSYKVTGSNPLAYALVAPAPDSILPYSGPFIVQAVDAPMEEISLNFEEIKVTYTECDSTGKSKGNIEYSWKVEEGES